MHYKKKYDIIQIGFIPPPYGGASVYIKRLIEKLNESGYKVGGYYTRENKDSQILQSKMFHLWRWLSTLKFLNNIFQFAREIAPYKIVHSHFSLDGMVYLWTFKNISRKKIIITVHNSMIDSDYYTSHNYINRFFLSLMTKSDVQWIAVSHQAKNNMLQLPLHFKTPIHIIPAYIPIESASNIPLSDSIKDYIDAHEKIIVFYGHSFMNHNGVDIYGFETAINMYANIIEKQGDKIGLIYIIAETQDSVSIEYLKRKAAKINVKSKIFWKEGAIENMQQLWKVTDVYVRPTYTDGDSVAVRETLDMGVRVVASNVCWRPEGVILYHYGDIDDFILKVDEALQMGKGEIRFNSSFYEEMLDIYKKIL